MPERGFQTEFWSDPFVRKLTANAQHLFIYLWTNQHCNQAGLYQITLDTIALETRLPEEAIPDLLASLEPKAKWYRELDLIWVKNFIKHQTKSPKFLAAAAKCLTNISNNGIVKEVLKYNQEKHTISIPYQYYMDRVSILTRATASSASASASADKELEVVKGEEKPGGDRSPRSRTETEETLCEGDQSVISTLCSVDGFSLDEEGMKQLVARMRTEFPDVDILAECKTWAVRKLEEPLGPRTRAAAQLWNWMRKARQFETERRVSGQYKGVRPKPQQARTHAIKRISGD